MTTYDSPSSSEPVGQRTDRTWEIFCHLAGLLGFVFPFGNIVGPLVIWLVKKDVNPEVDFHGKEAINFQISMSIYTILAGLSLLMLVGIVLLPLVILLNVVLMVIAAVKTSNGERYRYPISIPFLN